MNDEQTVTYYKCLSRLYLLPVFHTLLKIPLLFCVLCRQYILVHNGRPPDDRYASLGNRNVL